MNRQSVIAIVVAVVVCIVAITTTITIKFKSDKKIEDVKGTTIVETSVKKVDKQTTEILTTVEESTKNIGTTLDNATMYLKEKETLDKEHEKKLIAYDN